VNKTESACCFLSFLAVAIVLILLVYIVWSGNKPVDRRETSAALDAQCNALAIQCSALASQHEAMVSIRRSMRDHRAAMEAVRESATTVRSCDSLMPSARGLAQETPTTEVSRHDAREDVPPATNRIARINPGA
jgi:hypothetical protein